MSGVVSRTANAMWVVRRSLRHKRAFRTVQDDRLSQRDRAAGCVSFGQKWMTGTERQYFTDIIGLSSTIVT